MILEKLIKDLVPLAKSTYALSVVKSFSKQCYAFLWTLNIAELDCYVQSTLVISTSVISNNHLSRRKNLVLV